MDLNCSDCLICLDKIVPYILPDLSTDSLLSRSTPTFATLCKYLDLEEELRERLPSSFLSYLQQDNSDGSSGTPLTLKVLCLRCFENVEQLHQLHFKKEEITAQIDRVTKNIRNVIVGQQYASKPLPRRAGGQRKRNVIVRCEQADNLCDDDGGTDVGDFIQGFHGLVKSGVQKNVLFPTQFERQIKNEDDNSAEKLDANAPIKMETSDVDDTQNELAWETALRDDDEEYVPGSPGNMGTDSEDEDDMVLPGKSLSLEDGDHKRVKTRKSRPRKNRQVRVYNACTICGYREFVMYKFVEHMLSHENDAGVKSEECYSCEECDKTFSIKLNLDLHVSQTHNVPVSCDQCQNKFATRQQLIDHLKTKHPEDHPNYQCKSCPKVNTGLDHFLRHMREHSSSKFLMCPLCDLTSFPKLMELYKHFRTVHPDHITTKHKCPRCSKLFLVRKSLRAHLLRCGKDDDDDKVYCCTICNNDRKYKNEARFQEHMTRMHSGRFVCEECGKGFASDAERNRHVAKHKEDHIFPCPHCPKTYLAESSLISHLKLHSGDDVHTCDTCGKRFPEKCQLKRHSLTHVKVRPEMVCGSCGKKFKTVDSLRYHDKVAHQAKSYECKYCHHKFSRSNNLRDHLRTHTGERPFNCLKGCGKNFNRRDIMLTHMSVHGYNKAEALQMYREYKGKSKE